MTDTGTRLEFAGRLTNLPQARCFALTVVLGVLLAQTGNAQATIEGISVDTATIGTIFEITGSGFGSGGTKVFLAQDGTKVKKTRLKVLTTAASKLKVRVMRAIAGTFTVLVQPKGSAAVESEDTLDIVAPEIVALGTAGPLMPNEEATMTVAYAASKPKVALGGLKAKVLSVQAVADGDADLTSVTFRVPKKLPNGTWAATYTNKVGTGSSTSGITVVSSSAKLGKFQLTASLQGAKPFKANIDVDTSAQGPTTLRASKKTSTYTIVLPFVHGGALPPQAYDAAPASIHYVDSKTGQEFMSTGDDVHMLVSTVVDGIVAGSFSGTLHSVTEGAATRQVSGTFIYDGRFDLVATGGNTSTVVLPGEPAPRIDVQVLSLTGATGAFGYFMPGDSITATFRLVKDDGTAWILDEMSLGRAMVSGPSSNYQRVITQQTDVRQAATANADGSFTYVFPPLPDTYVAPYNDSESFGTDDGELTGEPLLEGTYTLALWFGWTYSVSGRPFDEVGTKTLDFLIGSTPMTLSSRQVVKTDNCNQCHVELQTHDGLRRTNEMCVLCHTAGAEDRNNPEFAGGTPGVSIAWNVMIHKIHSGAHLPSVLGVTTDQLGMRDYTVDPKPYELVGSGDIIHDYSHVHFPAWPNHASPMPRDVGYGMLDDDAADLEDEMRSGVTSCYLCHGDPDGDGPLTEPADGSRAFTEPTRNVCVSCHDDWVVEQPYISNGTGMQPQFSDNSCDVCHPQAGGSLAVEDSHLHPLLDPNFATGVVFDLLSVSDAGAADGDGSIETGEKIAVTFTIQDSMGVDIDPADLDRHDLVVAGPSENMNILVAEQSIPAEVLTGPQPFTMYVPMRVYFEEVGVASDGLDVFMTDLAPHWDAGSQDTEVYEHSGFGDGDTVLSAAVTTPVNFVDVDDPTGFAHEDYLVIDFGNEDAEYLRVQTVQGNRLWFSSPHSRAFAPGPQHDHPVGVTVREATMPGLEVDTHYTLDAASGTITEIVGVADGGSGFGDGNPIVVIYTTDYTLPETFPLAINAGPDLTEADGGWAGKSLVAGTYSLGMWGQQDRTLELVGESNSYQDGASGVRREFLVGGADELEPYNLIAGAETCYTCHVDIQFHDGEQRGWDSCLMCHGTAAAGDRPQYVAANAPATDGVTINFREMLHKLHHGAELTNGDAYIVVGDGEADYPDNFVPHGYGEVGFPPMPSGTLDCAKCHGAGNDAWHEPEAREHPLDQTLDAQEWNIVCAACHDTPAAAAHIETQTSPTSGAESCATCHGAGQTWAVEKMHLVR